MLEQNSIHQGLGFFTVITELIKDDQLQAARSGAGKEGRVYTILFLH